MNFRSKLLPTDRWGIYDEGGKLLATVGCRRECQKILKALQQRQCSSSLAFSNEFQKQLQQQAFTERGLPCNPYTAPFLRLDRFNSSE